MSQFFFFFFFFSFFPRLGFADAVVRSAVTQQLIHKLVLRRPASIPLLDTRPHAEYTQLHLLGSSHIAAQQLSERASELPPKGASMCVIADAADVAAVEQVLMRLGYVHNELVVSNEALWTAARAMADFVEAGSASVRMWRPSAFLASWIDLIERRVVNNAAVAAAAAAAAPVTAASAAASSSDAPPQRRTALDLACGSGRDAIFLSERGWRVTAVDYLPQLLERCAELSRLCDVEPPTLLHWDIEQMHREQPLHERFGAASFDLIHVSRYLHRPLYESLRKMVRPGGFIVYSTFMRGCEELGKPRRAQFILEINELKEIFGPAHGFFVYEYAEKRLDDYRPLQHICAQKLAPDQVAKMLSSAVKRSGDSKDKDKD